MAEMKIGRVRIGWKGEYDEEATYEALDAVSYKGASYIAKQVVSAGAVPNKQNSEYWQLMADKGGMPSYEWGDGSNATATSVRFEQPDGSMGEWVDLKGPKGDKGDKGDAGTTDFNGLNNVPQTAIRWPNWSEVSSKPEAATRWPSWDEVSDKPSSFPVDPSEHEHNHLVTYPVNEAPFNDASRSPRDFNSAGFCVTFVEDTYGWPIQYGKLVNIPSYTTGQDGGAMQILVPYSQSYTDGGQFMWRVGYYNNAGWSEWFTAVDRAAFEEALENKVDTSDFSAEGVRELLKNADGNLDADSVGGIPADQLYSPDNPPPSASNIAEVYANTVSEAGTDYVLYDREETVNVNTSFTLNFLFTGADGSRLSVRGYGKKFAGAAVSVNGSQVFSYFYNQHSYDAWSAWSTLDLNHNDEVVVQLHISKQMGSGQAAGIQFGGASPLYTRLLLEV